MSSFEVINIRIIKVFCVSVRILVRIVYSSVRKGAYSVRMMCVSVISIGFPITETS